MGCGTGGVTYRLAKRGYDMIGLDISGDMLSVAESKRTDENILFLKQDMRAFELYGTVDAVVCVYDCMNYVFKLSDLKKIFENVYNYLNTGGLFLFDLNTPVKYRRIAGENPMSRVAEDFSYIWESEYDESNKTNECAATFFVMDKESGLYRRFTELHRQKAYDDKQILRAAEPSGLRCVKVFNADTMGRPGAESERLYYVLKKQ